MPSLVSAMLGASRSLPNFSRRYRILAGRFSTAGVTTPEAGKLPNFASLVSVASFAFCGALPLLVHPRFQLLGLLDLAVHADAQVLHVSVFLGQLGQHVQEALQSGKAAPKPPPPTPAGAPPKRPPPPPPRPPPPFLPLPSPSPQARQESNATRAIARRGL